MPYSGLFSLGANFPEFPECTYNSGKFILGCCIKLNQYGSLAKLSNAGLYKAAKHFTTIAAANVEVIAGYHECYEWF